MDSRFKGSNDSANGYQYVNVGSMSPGSEEFPNYANFFNYTDPSVDLTSVEFPTLVQPPVASNGNFSFPSYSSSEAASPDDNDPDSVLKYISQVLLEEDMDEKPCMFHDSLALQAAEKPFYDVLGKSYPLSPDQPPFSDHSVDSPDDSFPASTPISNSGTNVSFTNTNMAVSVEESRSLGIDPIVVQPSSVSPFSFGTLGSVNGIGSSGVSMPAGFNIHSDRDSMIQFQKGVEEANKFLPKTSNLVIDLDRITYPKEPKDSSPAAKNGYLPERSRTRRIHYRDGDDLEEGRRSKQSAISIEDADELSEIFDRVLLPPKNSEKGCYICSEVPNVEHKRGDDSKKVVDLRTLLILGAQAVASDDQRTAVELLRQIRQHASPLGDGSQRLAHSFANALEARLVGTGSQIYTALSSKRTTAAEILKAYQLYVSFCPFKKISIIFSNFNTLKFSKNRKKVHIIDFGILYGFQWPALIHHLSERPGGPPLLRITGIELPQPGFRPAERVEETGRRLAKYCERFGVPFEYHAIAQKWETIKLEDLKLRKDEYVVVNCLYRFKNLLDETIAVDSPRDAVLRLIRKIKPDKFVHAVFSGSFNAPFFMTRFREALFYYSTLFDMFDTNVSREDPERLMYEREFYGREIMNVVACEGTERVERPETYKQWQFRNMRAGFKQSPLDPEIMEKLRHKMKFYHKDYSLDVDGNWVLLGWKGRLSFAIAAWTPS